MRSCVHVYIISFLGSPRTLSPSIALSLYLSDLAAASADVPISPVLSTSPRLYCHRKAEESPVRPHKEETRAPEMRIFIPHSASASYPSIRSSSGHACPSTPSRWSGFTPDRRLPRPPTIVQCPLRLARRSSGPFIP